MGDGKDFLRLYDFQNTDDIRAEIGYEGYE